MGVLWPDLGVPAAAIVVANGSKMSNTNGSGRSGGGGVRCSCSVSASSSCVNTVSAEPRRKGGAGLSDGRNGLESCAMTVRRPIGDGVRSMTGTMRVECEWPRIARVTVLRCQRVQQQIGRTRRQRRGDPAASGC